MREVFLRTDRKFWAGITVVFIYTVSILISQSSLAVNQPDVLIGITYDLTLVAPLLYLLIIWNSRIPKFTALPVFIIGFLIASQIIPDYRRSHLDFIELVMLPLVELTVIVLVVINVRRAIREIRINRQSDRDIYSVLKKSACKVLENQTLGKVFATEIAMFYFGLFRWKRLKPETNQFTGYKENGIIAIFITLVFLVIAETLVVHLLLIRWNEPVAWIIFGLSIYAGVQLLGHTKALLSRFTELTANSLILRYGLFGDAEIPHHEITTVTAFTDELKDKDVKQLKMLGSLESHNLLIELKTAIPVESVYGTRKMAKRILLHLDDHRNFIDRLKQNISSHD